MSRKKYGVELSEKEQTPATIAVPEATTPLVAYDNSSFSSLLRAHKILINERNFAYDTLEYQFQIVFRHAMRSKYPKSKNQDNLGKLQKKDPELHEKIKGTFLARAEELSLSYREKIKELERALDEAAERSVPRITTESLWTRMTTIWSSTYRSQTQSVQYARAQAENHIPNARVFGIEARVIEEKNSWGGYSFHVWVGTDPTGVEILKRKKIRVRDWVRSCWAKGVNPRVYNPFLPHGYEEKVGLDYFGGEKKTLSCRALMVV